MASNARPGRPRLNRERVIIGIDADVLAALDALAGKGSRADYVNACLRDDERIAAELAKQKEESKPMGHVTLYEDSAGSLWLHAEGGKTLYSTPGERGTAADEMAYVAQYPDGNPGDWSDEWQLPWNKHKKDFPPLRDESTGERHMIAVALWEDGRITVIDDHGAAASAYLDIPLEARGIYGSPEHIRATWAKMEAED